MLDKAALKQAASANEGSNEIPIESLLLSVAGNEAGNDLTPESGVYTEGGLVFVPDVDANNQPTRCNFLLNVSQLT